MKYSDERFDALLKEGLERAVDIEWQSEYAADAPVQSPQLIKIIKTTLKKANRPPLYRRALRPAAAVFLVILISASLMVNSSIRGYVAGLVRTWFPDHVNYSMSGRPSGAFDLAPGYIPEGFFEVDSFLADGLGIYTKYENQDGSYIMISVLSGSASSSFDNEHSTYRQVEANGRMVELYETTGGGYPSFGIIFLEEENLMVNVVGTVSAKEIIKIITQIE